MPNNNPLCYTYTTFFPVANGTPSKLLSLTISAYVGQDNRKTGHIEVIGTHEQKKDGEHSVLNARNAFDPTPSNEYFDITVSLSECSFKYKSFGLAAAIADQAARNKIQQLNNKIAATGVLGENGKIERVGKLKDKLTAVLESEKEIDFFYYPLDCVEGTHKQISQKEIKKICCESDKPNIKPISINNIRELERLWTNNDTSKNDEIKFEWKNKKSVTLKYPKAQNKFVFLTILILLVILGISYGIFYLKQNDKNNLDLKLEHELSATSKAIQVATKYNNNISSENEWLREIWQEEFPKKYEAVKSCSRLLQSALDGINLNNRKNLLHTCHQKRTDLDNYLEEIAYLIGIGNHLELAVSQFRKDLYTEEQKLKKYQTQLGELNTNFDTFPAKDLTESIENISSGVTMEKVVVSELCGQQLYGIEKYIGKTQLYSHLQNRCDQILQGWNGLHASLLDIQKDFRDKTLSQDRQVLTDQLVAALKQLEDERSKADKFLQNQKLCLQKQVTNTNLTKLHHLDDNLDKKIHSVRQMLGNVQNAHAEALAAIRDLLQTELSETAQREQGKTRMTLHDSLTRSCREKDLAALVNVFDMTKITKGNYSLIDRKRVALFTKWMQQNEIVIDKDFYIQDSEVTIGQYKKFLHTLAGDAKEQFSSINTNGLKNTPIKVDYESAKAYINWMNSKIGSLGFAFSFATPKQWAAAMVHFARTTEMEKEIHSLTRGADEWSGVDCGDKVVTLGVSDTFKLTNYKGAKRCSPKLYQQGFRLVLVSEDQ